MSSPVKNLASSLNSDSFDTTSNATLSSNINDSHDFRKVQMPQPKIGLGSTEGDLIYMATKYLEIVGLVVFVWILGILIVIE
jgi:hypothetical protein